MNPTSISTATLPHAPADVVGALKAIDALDCSLVDASCIDLTEAGALEAGIAAARELVAALEELKTARAALSRHCFAGGKATCLADDGNAEVEYADVTAAEAAQRYVDEGSWGDVESTVWIRVRTRPALLPDEGWRWHTIPLQPDEPDCADWADGHDWRAPHSIVGGCRENPGVWGSGGGVVIHEVCVHCGAERVTDTWAQDHATGEQGLTSVSYTEGKYTDAVRAWQIAHVTSPRGEVDWGADEWVCLCYSDSDEFRLCYTRVGEDSLGIWWADYGDSSRREDLRGPFNDESAAAEAAEAWADELDES
jgi:hypothetical protein